jgi:hypothetical protein
MYSCASKLGELKQKIHPHLDAQHDTACYDKFRDEYHGILKLYETHSNNDFRGDYTRAKLEMPENYTIKGTDWWLDKAHVYWSYLIDFLSYFTVVGILGWVICWLWFGDVPSNS